MRPHDYQKLALLTAPEMEPRTLDPMTDQILHGAIGLSGEIGEIFEAGEKNNMPEEIGDCFWYIAVCLHGAGYDMEDMEYESIKIEYPFYELVIHSSRVLDQAKRLVYYQAPLTHVFVQSIRSALKCLSELAELTKMSVDEIMGRNIEKLKIRYPKKFDSFHATRRNLENESKAFE